MDNNLEERVMIERVELIARLTATGVCGDRDKEVALSLIAELARGKVLRGNPSRLTSSNLLS